MEGGASTDFRLPPDAAAMAMEDSLDQRQPETDPREFLLAVKPLENAEDFSASCMSKPAPLSLI